MQVLRARGFSKAELDDLAASLKRLTNRVVNRDSGLWRVDSEKIKILESRQASLEHAGMDHISRIYWLMEDCKRYGTLPFAGLARAGFIAVQTLRSLVAVGALDRDQYHAFIASLDTVSGHMKRDLRKMSRTDFLARYGHLRPGTYDILSPRYDEDPDRYLNWTGTADEDAADPMQPFSLSLAQVRKIDDLIKRHDLQIDVVSLFDFMQAAIQGREYAKFVFTRSLSRILSLLGEFGAQYGLSREDMSFFDANLIDDLYTSSGDLGASLRRSIEEGRAKYALAQSITLPPVIAKPDDVWAFHVPATEPNFITQGIAQGAIVGHDVPPEKFKGAIVMLPSADPGFDWLFSHPIAGFITAYGGVNSHMAIRAGELNLPAVIGAGETLYRLWRQSRHVRIDCAARRVEVLG